MSHTRSLTSAASAATAATVPLAYPPSPRQRLRAVDRNEVARVVDLLPPGATWLPAPQHAVPALPGQPPMVGYLVLVPAGSDDLPPIVFAPQAVPQPLPHHPAAAATAGDELVRIDSAQRTAEVDGRVLDLTYLEFELLAHLVAHPHRVHSRDQLVTTVWGYGHVGDGRTVDVHVARLRRKLGAAHRGAIQTVRRVGYKYAP
ncbi:winged helix-turn-helix domain-containing protein [Streptomyces vinaceus]|uniref:winged helix-turn-helix domain-containing protein n=1 Tax=Streptomyces vinaceus TaxID=1960 RepID=UPI0036CB2F00